MSQFTTHIPPPILFRTPVKSTTTTTRPAHGLTPSSVSSWNFVDQVRQHFWDENIRLNYDPLFIDSHYVHNEAGVRHFFDSNILNNLEYCIKCAIPGKQLEFDREQQIPQSGIPDYSFYRERSSEVFYRIKNTVEHLRGSCRTIQQ